MDGHREEVPNCTCPHMTQRTSPVLRAPHHSKKRRSLGGDSNVKGRKIRSVKGYLSALDVVS